MNAPQTAESADAQAAQKYPPLSPGTRVKTTAPNEALRREWTTEAWNSRQWGVEGTVITHHDSHGLCYEVRHPDKTIGGYDPSELSEVPIDNKTERPLLGFMRCLNRNPEPPCQEWVIALTRREDNPKMGYPTDPNDANCPTCGQEGELNEWGPQGENSTIEFKPGHPHLIPRG